MDRDQEIKAVKALGDAIGYGNMMDIASALWAEDLEKSYGIAVGAFVPVCLPSVEKQRRKIVAVRQEMMKIHCRNVLARLGGGEG